MVAKQFVKSVLRIIVTFAGRSIFLTTKTPTHLTIL